MFESANALAKIQDLSTADVEAVFARAQRLESRARHLKLLALNVLDERRVHETCGAIDTESWVMAESTCTRATAKKHVRMARKLAELPHVADAALAGRMSWDQLESVAQLADSDSDETWAREGSAWAPKELQRMVNRRKLVTKKQARVRHREREMRIWADVEAGMVRFSGALPDSDGAIVVRAIELEAAKLGRRPDGSWESLDARRADALVELASQRLADDADPPRTFILVDAPAAALLESSSVAGSQLIETDLDLSIATVRRLACDATMQAVFMYHDCPVALGPEERKVPRWLRRQLMRRDRSCRFPGCDRTRFLHAHHMVHWADGGPTELWNLILLCPYHHRYLHENKWSVRGDPSIPDGIEFANAAGNAYRHRRFENDPPAPVVRPLATEQLPSNLLDVPCLS
jgi:hypothetical protein